MERDDSAGVVVVDVATSKRLRVTRPVYDLMCKFRMPCLVSQVIPGPLNASVSRALQKLVESGFLQDPDWTAAESWSVEKAMARVSPTLFLAPHRQQGDATTDVAIFGIPFDSGNVVAPGARGGPDAIRAVSCEQEYRCDFATGKPLGWFDLDLMSRVLAGVTISDWGNLRFRYGQSPEQIFGRVEAAVAEIMKGRSFPVCLGGDHSATYPIVKAIQSNQPVNVIWLDAHTDCGWLPPRQCNHHGNVATRILQLPNVSHMINVGYRGFAVISPSEVQEPKLTIVTPSMLRRQGIDHLLKALPEHPCYISLDVDCIDPAFAPATSTPVPGGLTPEEVKETLRAVARWRKVIGLDVVEVNPLRDHGTVTAMRACQLITACLHAAFEHRAESQIAATS
jgi:agmatinase